MIVEPAEWKARVCSTGCVVHENPAQCEWPLRGHHIITQQQLRKHGLKEHAWDVRNGLCLCESAHRRHHSRRQPVPRALLPLAALDFADELGLDYYIERFYPLEVEA